MPVTSWISRAFASLRRLVADRRGVAAVFLAIALVPLVGGVGLAVDSAVGYLLRARLSKSLDAAALAAGRDALDPDAEAVARDYFDANFGAGGGAVITDFSFELDPTAHFVTVSARAERPTYFMKIFGQNQMQVTASTVVERQTRGVELALVLDNTGSMYDLVEAARPELGTKLDATRQASRDLIDIVFGQAETVENVWVSLVPYVATVSVGKNRLSLFKPNDQVFSNPGAFGSEGWRGCVMAQPLPYDTDDTPPPIEKLSSYLYPKTSTDNNWPPIVSSNIASVSGNALAKGPNLACPTEITPLTASKTQIMAGINDMQAWRRGGTASNLGLTWGWRTISPRWRGLWGDPGLPLDYDGAIEKDIEKVVVLMTDGDNYFYDLPPSTEIPGSPGDPRTPSDYTAYGRVNAPGPVGLAKPNYWDGIPVLNARLETTCNAMKANGIEIYSVVFSETPSPETQVSFERCASDPGKYFYAPKAGDLNRAFRSIGGQLANLRIVK
ncbi:Flp pilus assembly protein TadG [Amaricoccus macauensis]|uniref:Flp pilus assembly protein TadG n=1 Tax=Amaricoccus macauensis TaxID=57001 RepID=A0A840SK53_9RHOB|nr:pilus assembly protein TadG-related protein [Amaricoccus macauensis]MBB5220266.1 Flp pilus assembly protein TadG [Amaricoccus macauensis]